jgi:protein-S-isoprenylcysteine O-methyltransferase Ste14
MSLQLLAAVGFAVGFYSITAYAVTRARRLTGRSPLVILRSGTAEEKTSVALLLMFPITCVAVAAFPAFELFRPMLVAPVLTVVGVLMLAGGLWLHAAALRTLGGAFQIGVDTSLTPGIVTAGPYRYIRHPVYAAFLAYFAGAWLLLPTALFSIFMPFAIVRVILQARHEEAALAAAFGSAYTDYMRSTARFIPGVF